MSEPMIAFALVLTAYAGLRIIKLSLNQKVAQPAINRQVCQFCEQPLPRRLRLFGVVHCSAECKTAERFKLGRAVDGISGGPLYL
jgi:hypothetical protein